MASLQWELPVGGGGTLKPDSAAPTPSLLCLLSCVTLGRKTASLGSGSLAAKKGPPRWVVTGSKREIKCRGGALCCRAPGVWGDITQRRGDFGHQGRKGFVWGCLHRASCSSSRPRASGSLELGPGWVGGGGD